ncbi:MAG: hypothetical protein COC01_01440 [Bacteroidetes bacterium]|nr:MAG: hypothetical protein COC01_01440 [Bacteroidota bacterium]
MHCKYIGLWKEGMKFLLSISDKTAVNSWQLAVGSWQLAKISVKNTCQLQIANCLFVGNL